MGTSFFLSNERIAESGEDRRRADTDFQSTVAANFVGRDLDEDLLDARARAKPEESFAHWPTLATAGRYLLKNELGAGASGNRYVAHDPSRQRTVCVKVLSFSKALTDVAAFDTLFQAEARKAAQVSHPCLAQLLDVGRSELGHYLVSEYLQGRDLRGMLNDGWRPRPHDAAKVVARFAAALAAAHQNDALHGGVKPASVFMVGRNEPKLLDLAVARVASSFPATADEWRAGHGGAEPAYMAPEQFSNAAIDARTDVYSLGVVFYELLTGTRPFGGGSTEEIKHNVLHHLVVPVPELNRHVSPALWAIVARAMAREPANRFASAAQFAEQLEHWISVHAPKRKHGKGHKRRRLDDLRLAASGAYGQRASKSRRLPATLMSLGAGSLLLGAWLWQGPWLSSGKPVDAAVVARASALPKAQVSAPAAPSAPALPVLAQGLTPEALAAEQKNLADPRSVILSVEQSPPAMGREGTASDKRAAPVAQRHQANPAPAGTGTVLMAIKPWGEVEIDGQALGTTPPLKMVDLPEGSHTVTIKHGQAAPYTVKVTVEADHPVTVRHRFKP